LLEPAAMALEILGVAVIVPRHDTRHLKVPERLSTGPAEGRL
jgi:hypothetical protein